MNISGVFSDYDGTLALLGVSRRSSRVRSELERVVRRVASEVPVAIVTSKGYEFVRPRTSFAEGWACACGLDIRARGEVASVSRIRSLERVARLLPTNGFEDVTLEEKRDSEGRLVGICVDWRGSRPPDASASRFLHALKRKGFHVSLPAEAPYADIFAGRPDKGRSVKELKRMLRISGPALYLGDSSMDNSAFNAVEVSVGVSSGKETESLECDYMVDFARVPDLLDALLEQNMEFTPDLPGLTLRRT